MFRGGGGRRRFNAGNNDVLTVLQYGSDLHFISIQQEQSIHRQLESELSRLLLQQQQPQKSSSSNLSPRQQVLELIEPKWYHRYDNNNKNNKHHDDETSNNGDTDVVVPKKKMNKKKHRSKTKDPPPPLQLKNEQQDNTVPGRPVEPNVADGGTTSERQRRRRILEVKGGNEEEVVGGLPIRTIHNMGTLASNYSSCPKVDNMVVDTNGDPVFQTTLVTQTSINRLWILKETCSRWKDPIVAVVFIPMTDGDNTGAGGAATTTMEDDETTTLSSSCPNLQIVHYLSTAEESLTSNYPVNRLRNVGLDRVNTSHVLVVDIDFVPSQDLHQRIHDSLVVTYQQQQQQKLVPTTTPATAIIVPAFERKLLHGCKTESECAEHLQRNSSFIPHTFDDLIQCYERKECIVFQSDVNWDGHSTTRSNEWMEKVWYEKVVEEDNVGRRPPPPPLSSKDDEEEEEESAAADSASSSVVPSILRKVRCFHTARYEPYVVLEWCPHHHHHQSTDDGGGNGIGTTTTVSTTPVAPYYDERFYGYGKNKIELISHLRKSGYQFVVLPEGFIVHNPHLESRVKEKWNNQRDGTVDGKEGSSPSSSNNDLHTKMDNLYGKFMKELDTMYKDVHDSMVKLCRHQ